MVPSSLSLVLALPLVSLATATVDSRHPFNPLRHLSGVAPYFEPHDPPLSPDMPEGCRPVKAAYLVRHAAIYANDFDYSEYIAPFIAKWKNHTSIDWTAVPSLHFLAAWSPPFSNAEQEMLTRRGKLEATQLAISLSYRYPNMSLPQRVWTSAAERTFKSAQAFVRGLELDDNTINVVSVDEKAPGANSLTPYKQCPAYHSSTGSEQVDQYLETFARPILPRLNKAAPAFNFTVNDVYGMMQLCGYESVVRGSSPFCDLDLFSPDDWLSWEYSADIMAHYNVGYGSDVSGSVGWPWLSATVDLLREKSGGSTQAPLQDMYVSFTHRELIPMVLVALGLFNNTQFTGGNVNATMPLDTINHHRAWRSSRFMAFLSNVALERMQCTGSPGFADDAYYRVLVNNVPHPLPGCGVGPGTSCTGLDLDNYVQARFNGSFSRSCGVSDGTSPDTLSIYTDPNTGNGSAVGKRST